ncbi:MAG: glutamate-5-semialdehyde dehydrogenase [bacterium]|nr:glutamate-5-semialdehyde dehydrogenase [bacterium]
MEYLVELGKKAKAASTKMNVLSQQQKNDGLKAVAQALVANKDRILKANEVDVKNAEQKGVKASLVDRLRLTDARIEGMSEGLLQVMALPDPIGEVTGMTVRPNGLQIGTKRVPLGVVGIIFESRPNVTADAFGLCFKTSNAVILKGGSDALSSNMEIVSVIKEALTSVGLPEDAIQLINKTDRAVVNQFMKMNDYVDVLIPRGGAGLIKAVVENATIPVIETGTGNCHVYVDQYADFTMALDIIENAKTQRTGVCNAMESLVVHSKVAEEFLPMLYSRLLDKQVEYRGDERACAIVKEFEKATDEDFYTEFLDLIMSVKVVDSIEEAIAFINEHNTKHSEAIITKDYAASQKFLNEIDAAAVYVNASTRFTDGFEFGFGAEIGISTQKLHARGPMGLLALTTTKYIIFGNGQIRE